jgi:hypothetical protein
MHVEHDKGLRYLDHDLIRVKNHQAKKDSPPKNGRQKRMPPIVTEKGYQDIFPVEYQRAFGGTKAVGAAKACGNSGILKVK